MSKEDTIGFVGLGNMGGPMAGNLARAGRDLVVHDAAGTQARAPDGAAIAGSVSDLASRCAVVVLSLPDGGAVRSVASEIATAPGRTASVVVDTSTVGMAAARSVHAAMLDAGVEYVDAPVSGGVSGARAGSISLMFAGRAETFERLRTLLEPMAKNMFHVGERPGQGQAMKVLNNFLSGTAMAATAEAVAFGVSQDLDMKQILDVVNVSSGRNTATSDKFPNRVLTETYDAGFTSALLLKDLLLYEEAARDAGTSRPVSPSVIDVWRRLEDESEGADISRVYPFIKEAPQG